MSTSQSDGKLIRADIIIIVMLAFYFRIIHWSAQPTSSYGKTFAESDIGKLIQSNADLHHLSHEHTYKILTATPDYNPSSYPCTQTSAAFSRQFQPSWQNNILGSSIAYMMMVSFAKHVLSSLDPSQFVVTKNDEDKPKDHWVIIKDCSSLWQAGVSTSWASGWQNFVERRWWSQELKSWDWSCSDDHLSKGKWNAHYTSKTIQNGLVHVIGNNIRKLKSRMPNNNHW